MNFVTDVTKAIKGTIMELLGRIGRNLPGDHTVAVLLFQDQVAEVEAGGVPPCYSLHPVPGPGWTDQVARRLVADALAAHPFTVVVSFDTAILSMSKTLDDDANSKIIFSTWKGLGPLLRASNGKAPAPRIRPWISPIPITEVIDVLKAGLQKRDALSRGDAIHQTDVRDVLMEQDPVRYCAHSPEAGMPGFVSTLVAEAERVNAIKVERFESNARIWLCETADVLHIGDAGIKEASSSPSDSLVAPTATVPLPPAPQRDVQPPALLDYKAVLETHGMGPFQNLRDTVYDGMERHANQKWGLGKLIDAAITDAKKVHTDPDIPWGAVRNFLKNVMSRCAILKDEQGAEFKHSFEKLGARVAGLVEDFRTRVDAELVLFLLQKGGAIPLVDVDKVCGVLFDRRTDEFMVRLSVAVKHLRKEGLAVMQDEQISLAPPSSPAKVVGLKTGRGG